MIAKNHTYKPSAPLSRYVDRFYTFERKADQDFELPPVPPGTGLELLIHDQTPLSVKRERLPQAHSVCPRKILHFEKEKQVSFLSVRFKSGAFRHFSSIPFSELNDTFFSFSDLWEEQGIEVLQRLSTVHSIREKIDILESFLMEMFDKHHDQRNDKWDSIIDELYYHFDDYTIEQIAQKANLSVRQFERGFKAQFGITAKEFQKITRFQEVIKHTLIQKNPDYLQLALDQGYFDQSHFIRNFKSLTEKKPREYFTEDNFENHFYHKSINS